MPITLALPLDLTGQKVANRITNEQHVVSGLEDAIFATNFGPFYTTGLKVYSVTLGRYLVAQTEYLALHYYPEASIRSGLEVCCVIYILNPAHFGTFTIEYHAVGGEFVNMTSIIETLIENLQIDNRPVSWAGLIGAPDTFPPANHLHDLGDLYGFEYLTEAANGIREAILTGDQESHNEIYTYVDQILAAVEASSTALLNALNAHEESINNPHSTTKAQVGLGNVQNYGVATRVQAEEGALNNLYMTPQNTAYAIQLQALQPLNAHIGNSSNPHNTTKAQVGLGNVQNFAMATIAEANLGTASRYMGADVTLQLVTSKVQLASDTINQRIDGVESTAANNLAAHVNNQNNPHGTTKAQVGLGSVQNFPIATQAQAEAASSDVLYMTPLKTGQAIIAIAVNPLNAHIGNVNNPHNTTKAQVGLGSVVNYPVASQAEVDAGTAGRYVTADTHRANVLSITNPIISSLNAHTSNASNPHNTTAAQVGLGNVPNYAKASVAQAQAGLNDTTLMTPYLVDLAIDNLQAVKSVQGRSGYVTLNSGDRNALGLATNHSVQFNDVYVGSGSNTLDMLADGVQSGWNQNDGGKIRRIFTPCYWYDGSNSGNARLMSTHYIKTPYAFAERTVIAAGTSALTLAACVYSYKVLNTSGSSPLTIDLSWNNGPYADRDSSYTDFDKNTNEWAYSFTIAINPANRPVIWSGISFGTAGAPALVPNTVNLIVITRSLTKAVEDGVHYFSGVFGVFVGGGF